MCLGVKDTAVREKPSGSRYSDGGMMPACQMKEMCAPLSVWRWPKAERAALQAGVKWEGLN